MRRKIHYIIPLFFLLLILAPILFMGGLQAFQFYIKQRMELTLEKSALTTISFPVSEVQWYEEGREVMVQGRMFDIKSYTINAGIFTAHGVYDDDETEVVNLLNGHWSDKQQTHVIIQLLLLSHCLIMLALCIYSFYWHFYIKKNFCLFSVRYSAAFLPVIIPPPKASLLLT